MVEVAPESCEPLGEAHVHREQTVPGCTGAVFLSRGGIDFLCEQLSGNQPDLIKFLRGYKYDLEALLRYLPTETDDMAVFHPYFPRFIAHKDSLQTGFLAKYGLSFPTSDDVYDAWHNDDDLLDTGKVRGFAESGDLTRFRGFLSETVRVVEAKLLSSGSGPVADARASYVMDSFGITDPEFAKLVCEELLLMVQDGDNSDSDFDTAVRTYGDALHSELMFGDMDPFEHPFLSRVLRRCFQMGARDSVAQLQTEVRLRVGMFFVFEGNHYVELIFREIFELFREISDVIRSTQGEQRSSIAETLCKVSLQKSALERTRCVDASDPSRVAYEWRVMRAYLGRHIVKSEATQLLPGGAESRSWFYRHMPRILAEHAKARVVPRRIRYREELTREQVIAAVRYRTGGMKRAKIAEIFGVEAGPYFTQYLSLQVRNVIFPKFPDWFASANAPDVRKREGLFSGPKPEHTEPLQRFLRAEISRDTLRQALGLPDASDPVLDIAITAIKKANMPDLLGKRRPKSGLSDEAKLAIVSEYDLLVAANKGKKGAADDGVYDELMKRARVKSNISMRSTMTAWRKRLRGRGLYPSQK